MNVRGTDPRRDGLICLLLVAVTFSCFWGIWRYDFLNFDDNLYVYQNPLVVGGLNRYSVGAAFTETKTLHHWHPLTMLSYMLEVELFDLNPAGYHMTNLFFHMANVALLFLVLRRLTGSPWHSAFVAALFAVHPLNVEPVAWISSRKDVLSTFFLLLTLLAYHGYARDPGPKRYLLVTGCYSLGLMAKTMLMTLPFLLLLLDYWPLRRFDSDDPSGYDARKKCRRVVVEKLPLFGVGVSGGLAALAAGQFFSADRLGPSQPFAVRVANGFATYASYVVKMLWPSHLAPTYPFLGRGATFALGAAAVILLAAVSAFVWKFRGRAPYLVLGWVWYLVTLVPVSGVFQYGSHRMADRYTYVPLIGLFVIIAWGVPDLLGRWRHKRLGLTLAAIAAVGVLVVCTSLQVPHWRNSEALFRHTLAVTANNTIAHNQLGAELLEQGRFEEAAYHCGEALRIHPGNVFAMKNLAMADLRLGEYKQASELLEILVAKKPNQPALLLDLAIALAAQGEIDKAILRAEEALRLDPDLPDAHEFLALILRENAQGAGAYDNW